MNFSLCIDDFHIPSNREEIFEESRQYAKQQEDSDAPEDQIHENVVRHWMEAIDKVRKSFVEEAGEDNSLVLMLNTGARASMSQVSQLTVAKGMLSNLHGEILRKPVESNHREGLDTFEYFQAVHGGRKGLADAKFSTPKTGYLARRFATVARDLYIVGDDCGSKEGVLVPKRQAKGRTVLGEEGEYVRVRSPIFCKQKGGLCKKCYGVDPSTGYTVARNTAVGIVAAQTLSEPTTQMTLRTFHFSGAAELRSSPKVIRSKVAGNVKVEQVEDIFHIRVGEVEYLAHTGAEILVESGQEIKAGDSLASYVKSIRQEDVTNKLPLLEVYFEMRRPKVKAVVAPISGVVNLEPNGSDIWLYMNGQFIGSASNQPVFVHDGEEVSKGQFLSYGEANLRELFHASGGDLDLISFVFVNRLLALYEDEGVPLLSLHLEVLFRSLTELVRREDGVIGLRSFDEGEIIPAGAIRAGSDCPSWLKATSFGWVQKNLSTAAALNRTTYDLPSERILSGLLIPRRDEGFIYGKEHRHKRRRDGKVDR